MAINLNRLVVLFVYLRVNNWDPLFIEKIRTTKGFIYPSLKLVTVTDKRHTNLKKDI